MRFTAAGAASALGARLRGDDVLIDGVSYDSRALRPGQLFVPIVAKRDGHGFIEAAIHAGAPAYLTGGPLVAGAPAIEVVDTAAALLRLGAWGRNALEAHTIGITGSVGKTSVKDLTYSVVSRRYRTAASEKSLNNDLGLPATILNAPDDSEALVLEMGMRGFGHIRRLCSVARPTVGAVTRVAAVHTELVGDIEGVARAKSEIVEGLPPSGFAVLNADDERVLGMSTATAAQVLTFGLHAGDVRAENVVLDNMARAGFRLVTPWGSAAVRLGISGIHMAANAACAATIALAIGVPLELIPDGLAAARLSPWRMEVRELASGAVVINDAYNASPASVRAAVDTLTRIPARRRIAVLGVMAELADPEREHRAVAEYARACGVELITTGTTWYGVEPVADVIAALGALGDGDAVLVKGSRVAGLEQVAARLIESAG